MARDAVAILANAARILADAAGMAGAGLTV